MARELIPQQQQAWMPELEYHFIFSWEGQAEMNVVLMGANTMWSVESETTWSMVGSRYMLLSGEQQRTMLFLSSVQRTNDLGRVEVTEKP